MMGSHYVWRLTPLARPIEQMIAGKGGWSEWIHPLPGYLLQCCDCGLVHELEVAITKPHHDEDATNEGEDDSHVVVFRMRRASAASDGDE
jgi:hypothetical protein